MSQSSVAPDTAKGQGLKWHSLYSLHSAWVSYLPTMVREAAHDEIDRVGGIDFAHFLLALGSGVYRVSYRQVDGELLVGVAVAGPDPQADVILAEISADRAGVESDYLVLASTAWIDADLAQLLTEPPYEMEDS